MQSMYNNKEGFEITALLSCKRETSSEQNFFRNTWYFEKLEYYNTQMNIPKLTIMYVSFPVTDGKLLTWFSASFSAGCLK